MSKYSCVKEFTRCENDCADCDKKNPNHMVKEKKVSMNECLVAHFFDSYGILYDVYVDMEIDCPFNASGTRKADFYLSEYDLYVEVKGMITLVELNKLKWLSEFSGKKVYVFVIDNEDWDGYCDERIHNNAKDRKNEVLEMQFNELLALKRGIVGVDVLVRLSRLRLREYAITRSADIIRWNKISIERKMQKAMKKGIVK